MPDEADLVSCFKCGSIVPSDREHNQIPMCCHCLPSISDISPEPIEIPPCPDMWAMQYYGFHGSGYSWGTAICHTEQRAREYGKELKLPHRISFIPGSDEEKK